MNTARLVFGWLFLAGFTAAGTYYAMDEADRRIGLARFQLHEKLGVVKYASARPPINYNPQPPVNNQQPPINNNPQPPINNNPQPINNSPQPPINNTPQPINNSPQPPINNTPQPINNSPQPPINNNPQPIIRPQPPINNNPQPPINNNPPINRNPQPVIQTPPINQGPGQPQRAPVDTGTMERLIEVESRASALRKTWDTRKPAYGSLRPEIQTALTAMSRYAREARAAAQAGDAAAAKRLMDQAEKQMDILKQFDE